MRQDWKTDVKKAIEPKKERGMVDVFNDLGMTLND